jgi:hypothetical protein
MILGPTVFLGLLAGVPALLVLASAIGWIRAAPRQ